MELQDVKNRIDKGEGGWYLFTGEEPFLIRHTLSLMKAAYAPDPFTEVFNYAVFDGARIDVAALRQAVEAPPMMSDKKLVVWKYADFGSMKAEETNRLVQLLEQRSLFSHTVLVFICTADRFDVGNLPKKPSKLYNMYKDRLDIVTFPLSTDTQLLPWLKRHFDANGISADARVLHAMIQRCGHGMDTLLSEVEKVCMFAAANGRTSVTAEDILNVCAPTFESKTFALSNAIIDADRAAAYAALRVLRAERTDVLMVIGMMARTYAALMAVAALLDNGDPVADITEKMRAEPHRLAPFAVKRYIASVKKQGTARLSAALKALCRMDARMKSSDTRSTDYGDAERFVAGYLM